MNEQVIVVVTESEFTKAEAAFASVSGASCVVAPDAEEALAATIRETGARFAIVGPLPYNDALYAALPEGGVIARFGVGHDGIDKVEATNRGLLCTNTPGVLDQSVAELTMLMVSAAARHIVGFAGEMAQGRWQPRSGTELRDRTLAIIGCGSIGSSVARIASEGFHMNVISAGRSDDYRATVQDADFVSIHISPTPDNSRFVNRERLSMLPRHAWLINTARGMVLDEEALYDALADRRIRGAALDVYQHEPYRPTDKSRDLRTLPNVILTPHISSNTAEASDRIAERALRNVYLAEAGDFAAMDLLNPEVLSR